MTIPGLLLGHGASGTAATMAPWVEGLRERGVTARALDLPRGSAERAAGVFAAALAANRGAGAPLETDAAATPSPPPALSPATALATAPPGTALGGHSFGGRAASLAAARELAEGRPVAGLLLLSYPLHRPGRTDDWPERTAHWPALGCPVLLLSGESDPFARLDLLREAVRRLPRAELVTFPRLGHGLAPVLPRALDLAAAFLRSLAPADG